MSHDPKAVSVLDTGAGQDAGQARARLTALQEVALGLTSTLELEEVLQRVAEMAQRLAGASHAHIYLYNPQRDQLTLVARHWPPERTVAPPPPRRNGITYTVAHTGQSQYVPDASGYAVYPTETRPGALACLPLLKGTRVLGTLNLGFWQPREFDAETRDYLDLMARHAAIAIDNAQLYAASQRRTRELEALYEISLEINGELDLQALLSDLVRRSSELLGAAGGFIFMYDPERETLKLFAQHGIENRYLFTELRIGEGFSGRVAQVRQAMAVDDYHTWPDRSTVFKDVPFGAMVAAPLLWQDQLLGVLGLAMPAGNTRTFTDDEIRLVEQLAAQAAVAIQNARLYAAARRHEQELDRRVQELALVNEISRHINSLDLQEVEQSALDQTVTRFRAVYGAIGFYDATNETVTIAAVRPKDDPLLGSVLRVENNPDLKQARELRRAIVWKDDPDLVSSHPTRSYFRSRGTNQLVIAPLLVRDQLIGFMGMDPGTRELQEDEVNLLQTVANQIAIAMENARLAQMAIDKARIERELQLARSVQARFLAHESPALVGWDLTACWQPAREVSGDFYDFISLPGGRLGLVIGDVTDKGMPAALVMATTHAVIRAATWDETSPGRVLEQVNNILCPDMPPHMFVTCFYAILDPSTGRMRYANAGQNLPCHQGREGVSKVHAAGLPLGLMPGMPYEEREMVVEPGESILFYSDGLVEAHNKQREMFGFDRLANVIERGLYGKELMDALMQALTEFTGPEWEQEDDVTMVTLKRQDDTIG